MSALNDQPLVAAAIEAIHNGNQDLLRQVLNEDANLTRIRIDGNRTLLHVAADWPGHFPNGSAIVRTLVTHGADVNAKCIGQHSETPLHWAASSNDVDVLDALLDNGANIEATGAVIGGGTALADAVAFGQWQAAKTPRRTWSTNNPVAGCSSGVDRSRKGTLRKATVTRAVRDHECILERLPRRAAGAGRTSLPLTKCQLIAEAITAGGFP